MKIIKICCGVINYFICKMLNWGRFKSNTLCLFSCKSTVRIEKKGSIQINGKMSLSDYSEMIAIGSILIGNNVFVNKYSRIISFNKIEIGNNVLIAQFVSILDHDHNYSFKNNEIEFDGYNEEPIRIGNNVLIGDKVTILKGTVIGDNVVIGANSLVKGNIPSNSTVVSALANIRVSIIN